MLCLGIAQYPIKGMWHCLLHQSSTVGHLGLFNLTFFWMKRATYQQGLPDVAQLSQRYKLSKIPKILSRLCLQILYQFMLLLTMYESTCPMTHLPASSLFLSFHSLQFSRVAQLCPTLCDPMNCSTPGLPVHHQLPEFTQTHVHRVGDAIQPSHPLSSLSPPAPNPSQHQSLFQWVNSLHEVAKVLEFQL